MLRLSVPAAIGSAAALLSLALTPTVGLGQSYGLSEPAPGGGSYAPPTSYVPPQQTQPRYVQPGQPQNQPDYYPPPTSQIYPQPTYPNQGRPTYPGQTTYRPTYPPQNTNPPSAGNLPPGAVPHYRQGADGRLIPDGYTLNGVKYPGNGGGTRPTPPPYNPTQDLGPGPDPNRPLVGPRPNEARMGLVGTMVYGDGLRIDSVTPGLTAANMGLERGDLILGVNGQRVRDIQQFRDLLTQSGGSVNLTVRNVRNGQVIPVNGYLTSGGESPQQFYSSPVPAGGFQSGGQP